MPSSLGAAAAVPGLQARRFKSPPIGPLGAYVSLIDEQWGKPAEAAVGRAMNK